MGRSVSYPAGSVVAFRLLDDGEDADVDWAYECLVDEIIDTAKAAFPSFLRFDGWRGREDRILLRNAYADCGISTWCGLAAIWLAERDDAVLGGRCIQPTDGEGSTLAWPGLGKVPRPVWRAAHDRAVLEWRSDL